MVADELKDVMQIMNGPAVVAQTIRASVRLHLWEALESGKSTVEELANHLKAHPRGVKTLLDALTAIGLLIRDDSAYRPAPLAQKYFFPSSPDYLGDYIHIAANPMIWQALFDLDRAVRAGEAQIDHHAETPDHPFWKEFALGSRSMARFSARMIVQHLMSWGSKRSSFDILDVAAGSGMYGFTFLESFPRARLWSLDWPGTLERTRKNAEALGLENRVHWIPGDAFKVSLTRTWDLIIVSNFIHHFSPEKVKALFVRLRSHLADDGLLVVNDFFALSDKPNEDPGPYLFGIVMLVWTKGGRIYSLDEGIQLLESSGFRVIDRLASPEWRYRCLFASISNTP